jgi:hypothetical protein
MPLSQWNLEFLNHNSQRSYPLAAETTKKDITGSFEIPDDFLVGMDIAISPAMDMSTGSFFIRQIGLYGSGVQLILAYDSGTGLIDVASTLIPSYQFTRNKVFTLGGIDPYDDITGKVVVGKLDTIKLQPTGLFDFDITATRLEPQVVRPMIRGISALRIASSNGVLGDKLYGDIELVAGRNIQLTTVNTATETKIVISAISGEGTIADCTCTGEAATAPCIKTINGIAPAPDGNFNLLGDDCLTFEEIKNGLKLTDSCCAPCCGCAELESITSDLERFNAQRGALEQFVNQLAAENAAFAATVLGARLGDKRCLNCEG